MYTFNKQFSGKIRDDILKRSIELFLEITELKIDNYQGVFNYVLDKNNTTRSLNDAESLEELLKIYELFTNFKCYIYDISGNHMLFGISAKKEISPNFNGVRSHIEFNIKDFQTFHKFQTKFKHMLKEDFQFKEIKNRQIRFKLKQFLEKNNPLLAIGSLVIMVFTLVFSVLSAIK